MKKILKNKIRAFCSHTAIFSVPNRNSRELENPIFSKIKPLEYSAEQVISIGDFEISWIWTV